MKTIAKGDCIAVHYTGKLATGEVFDQSNESHPLRFEVGAGMLIPGFDRAVIGLKDGEATDVIIDPADAYGHRDPKRVLQIERARFGKMEPEIGMTIGVQAGNGGHVPATVKAVDQQNVTLDLNHPLAGETLHFNIRIAEIRPAGTEGNEEWLNEGRCCGAHEHGEGDGCGGCGGGGCGGH